MKVSLASTMRASISTCLEAMSVLAISLRMSSSLEAMSVTNSWLVRGSMMALPRLDRMRFLPSPAPPSSPNTVLKASAFW